DKAPPAIREATFTALGRLTGLTDLDTDLKRWEEWWSQNEKLDPELFSKRLIDTFLRSRALLSRDLQQTQDELVDTIKQLYRATPQEQRGPLLVRMLRHQIDAVRHAGIENAYQLTDLSPDVLAALRSRLEDPLPTIRQRAARRLLTDKEAADKVASLLAAGQEKRPEVLKAYLEVMAQ